MTHLAPRPAVDVDRDPDPDAHPPRYLGFPTAARFRPDVGAAQADDWLGALPRGSTLELHVHVPFCLRLCRFCCCRTQAARDAGALAAYVAALGAEASRVAGRLPEGAMVTEMHWFGGSPTILTPTLIRALDARIRAALPLAPGAPLSVEIEPHGVDPARLDALFEAGLTWARLGLQDFDLGVQRAIGREQDPARVAATFAALRARGVSGVAAELLYGLPLQDRASLLATCARLLALAPDRVTLVGYAHMPWMAKRQRSIPEASLPDAAARRDQFVAAVGAIRRAGYARCGVDQFALPGDGLAVAAAGGLLRRDLLGYAPRVTDAVIGLGAASISRFPQGYVQNVAETGAYLDRIAAGGRAGACGAALSLEDRVRGRAIEMLLCDLALDLGRLEDEFGDFARVVGPDLDRAAARFASRVRRTPRGLVLSSDGPLLARRVARVLDVGAAEPEARPN